MACFSQCTPTGEAHRSAELHHEVLMTAVHTFAAALAATASPVGLVPSRTSGGKYTWGCQGAPSTLLI